MSDLKLHKLNEAFIQFECEKSVAQELQDYFTFYVPGYQFMPAYKNKLWDGKIRLVDLRSFTIYHGLVPYIQKFCEERNYTLEISSSITSAESFSGIEAIEFIQELKLPKEVIPEGVHEHQYKAFLAAIREKRMLLLSPTGSGKSLIQYLIIRYLQSKGKQKGLMIVPRTSLVEQMFTDFKSYGYDSDTHVHRQYQGKDKESDKFLTITTWQSIYKNSPEYFEQFDFVLGDEAHEFKSKSLTTIMSGLVNTEYRIGCTGSIDGTQTHKLVLEGLFGSVRQYTTTSELIEQKKLADFKIKCLILKYPEDVCKASRGWDYQKEIEYIVKSKARNEFICNLALSLKGNSLVLFQLVEKHGKELYSLIKEKAGDRNVYFIYGKTDVEVRESVRSLTEKQDGSIIIASYGTFSTGINIRNLHNVVFASPSKSRVRNLQSIGRGLRIGDNKKSATLFDIADDFRSGKHVNFTLKHFGERVKIYDEQKFIYKFYNIEIKNG